MKTKDQLVSLGLDSIKADEVMLLQEKMLERAVKFQFKKRDGTIRTALGTLRRDKMVQEDGTLWEPKGESKPDIPHLMKYWDMGVRGWRCFTCADFLAMEV